MAASTEQLHAIQNFWLRYFRECGADLSREHYGPTLITLMSDETILYQARPSWLYYYALYCIGIIVAALFHQAGDLEAAGLVVLVFAGIVMVFRFRHLFTITSERIIARVGLIARNTNEIQLRHIRAVSVRQGVIERILGSGLSLSSPQRKGWQRSCSKE